MRVSMISGPPVYVFLLSEALAKQGVEVTMVMSQEQYHPSFENSGVRIVKLFDPADSYSTTMKKLKDYIASSGADLFHFQSTFSPRRDWLSLYFWPEFKNKAVYTAHNILPHHYAFMEKFALQSISRRFPRIIAHAQQNKQDLMEDFNIKENRIQVIPHGEISFYYRFTKGITINDARKKLGLNSEDKVVLFFGNLRKVKGLEYLIRAFPTVLKQVPLAKLVIAGPPADVDAGEYGEMIQSQGIAKSVIYRPEFISVEDVGLYFISADVVALPYLRITQSGVAFTAMSYGKPVVATASGGLPEVIEDGVNGYIVPSGDSVKLAEGIVKILNDSGVAQAMSREALRLTKEKYDWHSIAAQTIKVYEGLWKK